MNFERKSEKKVDARPALVANGIRMQAEMAQVKQAEALAKQPAKEVPGTPISLRLRKEVGLSEEGMIPISEDTGGNAFFWQLPLDMQSLKVGN